MVSWCSQKGGGGDIMVETPVFRFLKCKFRVLPRSKLQNLCSSVMCTKHMAEQLKWVKMYFVCACRDWVICERILLKFAPFLKDCCCYFVIDFLGGLKMAFSVKFLDIPRSYQIPWNLSVFRIAENWGLYIMALPFGSISAVNCVWKSAWT